MLSDGGKDIGASGNRFKDLYLSGSIEIENGTGNVGVGKQALNSNTGSNNTAVGYQAGFSNTTGFGNVAIGDSALLNLHYWYKQYGDWLHCGSCFNEWEAKTTFIGPHVAGVGAAGYSMTTGSKNTILGGYNGNQGGLDIRTSSNNIVLSDGDGNPRSYFDSSGNWKFKTSGSGSFSLNNNGWAYFTSYDGTYANLTLRNGDGNGNGPDYMPMPPIRQILCILLYKTLVM